MPNTNSVKAGYMGYAVIDDYKVRCTDFNVKLRQDALFYDHIIGLRDSIPVDIFSSKGDIGAFNEQKIFWRSGTKIVEGTINFPMIEQSARAFFSQAYGGDDFDVTLYYSCETGKIFTKCKVNTYSFTATAGDITNISIGIMGTSVKDGGAPEIFDEPYKILTFDTIKIDGTGADNGIVSFEFSINNNCIPIYTAGTNIGTSETSEKLVVRDIRIGMQSVTGSVTFYNDIGPLDQFVEDLTPRTVNITAGDFRAKLSILYQYPERSGQVSAYVRTIPFVGIGKAVQSG